MSPSFTESPARTKMVRMTKKVFRWLLILVIIIAGCLIYWKFFYTYSEGYSAGLLQKFSHKGAIFKTYEGEMIWQLLLSGTSEVSLNDSQIYLHVKNGFSQTLIISSKGKI